MQQRLFGIVGFRTLPLLMLRRLSPSGESSRLDECRIARSEQANH